MVTVNLANMVDGGWSVEQVKAVCNAAKSAGVNVKLIAGGTNVNWRWQSSSRAEDDAFFFHINEASKNVFVD